MSRRIHGNCGVPERKGKCELIEIYSTDHDMYQEVVRWCTECGGVVVDIDYDNRNKPGGGRVMQFPEMAKHKSDGE